MQKYVAELLGTFALTLVVFMSSTATTPLLTTPFLAALTLGLFVYTIGPISGCHINPAVTIGLFSVKKIAPNDTILYIVAQFAGALLAIIIAKDLGVTAITTEVFSLETFFAEMLGAFFFIFGIGAVVHERVTATLSGIVIGLSLLLGISIASLTGAMGILNPTVAFALNQTNLTYFFAPIVGGILALHASQYFTAHSKKHKKNK